MFIRDPKTAKIGEEILPFEYGNPPEFFRRKAEAELHDSPDKRVQGLRQIKELIKRRLLAITVAPLSQTLIYKCPNYDAAVTACIPENFLSLGFLEQEVHMKTKKHTLSYYNVQYILLSNGDEEKLSLCGEDKHTMHLEFEDDFLLQYLIGKKYNIPKAFSFIKATVNLKKKHPEAFSGFSYEEISLCMTENVLTVLPWRCQDGCAILAAHADNWDPEKICLDNIKRAIAIYLWQALREPMTQINGFKVIIDVKSNPLKHLQYITPGNVYLLYHGTQDCIPARYKEIHFVNDSLAMKAAWFVVKYLLSEKMKKRIYFHSSNEPLLKFFPKAILPVEFGGDLQNYEMYDWLRKATEPAKLEVLGGRPRLS